MANVGDKVTDLSELSNDKCYTIAPAGTTRGTWTYSAEFPDYLVSTLKTSESVDATNTNQQFAFLNPAVANTIFIVLGGVNSCITPVIG